MREIQPRWKRESKPLTLTDEQQKVFDDNIGLVHDCVWKYVERFRLHHIKDDLTQVAMMSFVRAIQKYNSKRGKLSTLAYKAMTRQLQNETKNNHFGVRVPSNPVTDSWKHSHAYEFDTTKHESTYTPEFYEETDVALDRLRRNSKKIGGVCGLALRLYLAGDRYYEIKDILPGKKYSIERVRQMIRQATSMALLMR